MSPLMTVLILVVLWLIVIVPMVLRRNDERRRERSVAEWGRGMRALGRRATVRAAAASAADSSQVFVPRPADDVPGPARRPVPAAQEALMYPPDRTELTEARSAMLTRRRRSLGLLAGGTVLFGVLGLVMGGFLWVLAGLCLVGLAGYLWFLRSQALNDRARRETRQSRAETRRSTEGYDATEEVGRFEAVPESVVRIDDDDIELQSMDTIDLTGLYSEEAEPETVTRRAS